MNKYLSACIALIFFQSCEEYGDTSTHAYFALDSLVTAQVEYLSARQTTLTKIATVNEVEETETFEADSTRWAKELEIFREIDINSPGALNAYEIISEEGNLRYHLKSSEKQSGVINFIVNRAAGAKVESITADFLEENSLYNSERKYLLEFNGDGVLSKYRIDGRQKVAFGDWVEYRVEGNVM